MTSNEKEKVSLTVVVPTLNRASLKEAISSCGDLPVEVEKDTHRTGAGPTRNRAVQRVTTPWVAFLDDDDIVDKAFLYHFQEALEGTPEADLIIFRMRFPDGRVLPKVPRVVWGNVGIAMAVKTEIAKKHPFVKGENSFNKNEDFVFAKTIEENGYKVVFSPRIGYHVKPSKEAQANAIINRGNEKSTAL